MVPVQALEVSTLAFVDHNWGQFRAQSGTAYPEATRKDIIGRCDAGIGERHLLNCL